MTKPLQRTGDACMALNTVLSYLRVLSKKYMHRHTGLLAFDSGGMEISLATLEVDRFSECHSC
jgi:hypothetical protein